MGAEIGRLQEDSFRPSIRRNLGHFTYVGTPDS